MKGKAGRQGDNNRKGEGEKAEGEKRAAPLVPIGLASPFSLAPPPPSPSFSLTMRARAAGIAIMGALLLLLCTAVLPIAALPGWEARQAASASRPTSSSSSSSTEAPFTFGPSVYTAPSAFPTSAFQSFYLAPTGTDQEPRPAITDVAHTDFYPDSLVNPTMLPTVSANRLSAARTIPRKVAVARSSVGIGGGEGAHP